jgi:hypothetical protein
MDTSDRRARIFVRGFNHLFIAILAVFIGLWPRWTWPIVAICFSVSAISHMCVALIATRHKTEGSEN